MRLLDLRRRALFAMTRARSSLPHSVNTALFQLPTGTTTLHEACVRAGLAPLDLGAQQQGWPTILDGSDPDLTTVLQTSCRRQPPAVRHAAAELPDCRVLGRECTAIAPAGLVMTDVSPDDHPIGRPHRALATRLIALPPRRLAGTSALLGDVGHRNIFHWFFDILPRASMLRRAGFPEPDQWIVPRSSLAVVPELLRAAGVPTDRCISMAPWSHVSCDRLQFCTAPGRICEPQSHAVESLRVWLRPSSSARNSRVIVIGRRGRRRLVNETALMAALSPFDPILVHLEGMPLSDQVNSVAGARCVIGPHGAGLAHMIHAQSGASVIELLPERYPNPSFFHLAGSCGLRYGCIRARAAPGSTGSPATQDIVIDTEEVCRLVSMALHD